MIFGGLLKWVRILGILGFLGFLGLGQNFLEIDNFCLNFQGRTFAEQISQIPKDFD